MKKILFVLIAAFAVSFSFLNLNSCSSSTAANTVVHDTVFQHFWDPEQSGVSAFLIAVRFPSLQIGTAVGAGGTVIRTTDGGSTWASQISGEGADLYAVSFSDINTGIAVGSSGVVIKTTDGGATWIPLTVDITVQFRNVQMVGSQVAYVIGARYFSVDNTQGYVYKTTDGGLTWNPLTVNSAPGLFGISFVDALNGWVSGHQGTIFHTTDGGASWTKQNSTIAANQQVAQIAFADLKHGIAVGPNGVAGVPDVPSAGFIATTSDGGVTWTKVDTKPLTGLWMPDVNHAVAVGYNGTVMETADGGATWNTKTVGSLRLQNVYMNDQNNGAMVGENGKVYIVGAH